MRGAIEIGLYLLACGLILYALRDALFPREEMTEEDQAHTAW